MTLASSKRCSIPPAVSLLMPKKVGDRLEAVRRCQLPNDNCQLFVHDHGHPLVGGLPQMMGPTYGFPSTFFKPCGDWLVAIGAGW